MTTDSEKSGAEPAPSVESPTPSPLRRSRRTVIGAATIGALLVGIVAGGAGTALIGGARHSTLVLQPAAISSLEDGTPAAIKGRVAEIFGNKIIVDDGSGRALVETGRAGEGGGLAAKGETVTAQGRFEDGFLHAEMLVHADGKVVDLGPPKPPHGPLKHRLAELADR